ncbi:cytochrome ubiquinol oxidase subunit I [Rubrobacter taiwanensis]|nr:cytochrome ubiquinol oxidase subunit I [Rubrobacter taiwanensis]
MLDLPAIEIPVFGARFLTGAVMLTHIFFATLFVGYAMAAPILEWWGARTGKPRMERLARSLIRFNVLTFSVGATFAVMFMVLLVGLYPRVTAALFTGFFYFIIIAMASMVLTLWMIYVYYYKWDRYSVVHKGRHIAYGAAAGFFIWVWMVIMSGIDTFMVTGGSEEEIISNEALTVGFVESVRNLFNPMFIEMVLHRTFGNLSWPAFAVAAWAGFKYARAKSAEDKSYYDWVASMGTMWGTIFLLTMPVVGYLLVLSMQAAAPADPAIAGETGAYDRLTTGATSSLLYINTIMVVGMFILANVAMYLGAVRHPERAGRNAIRIFGLIAALSGLYAISPFAQFPFLHMRYIMMGVMVLATLGALVSYIRGRVRFRYGSPNGWYRGVLIALGVLTAVLTLNMGFMKSNSRVPYTIYNQPAYQVEEERPPTDFGEQLVGE